VIRRAASIAYPIAVAIGYLIGFVLLSAGMALFAGLLGGTVAAFLSVFGVGTWDGLFIPVSAPIWVALMAYAGWKVWTDGLDWSGLGRGPARRAHPPDT
jgi:hypothetical protein